MSALMIGVLKGSSLMSVISAGGLCLAMVPLGFKVLREHPTPSAWALVKGIAMLIRLAAALFYLGRLG